MVLLRISANVGRNSELYDLTKQPVLIGDTVNRANHYENDCADKNEIVISPAVFNHLADRSLKELFKKRDNYYVTGCDYNDFFSRVNNRIEEENHDRDYRKPWCDD